MKRVLIISGGEIQEDFALAFLKKYNWEYVIGADRGILFCKKHQILPTHIVGDFDSAGEDAFTYFQKKQNIEIKRFHPIKDFTDTDIALKLALELGAEEIYILGGMGKRIDHLAANIRTLTAALKKGVPAFLVDEYNKIWLTDHPVKIKKEEQFGTYLSLFAFGGTVKDLSVQGAFYPLSHYRMEETDPLGVSNEIVEKECLIEFSAGILLVMESKDGKC